MIRMFDRARRARIVLVVLLMASVTIITIDFRTEGDGPLDKAGGVLVSVLGPVQRGLGTIFRPVGNFLAGFSKVDDLQNRINELERANADLISEREQIADISRENASLRKLLALRDRLGLKTTAAQVIGVGPSNFERSIFIDQGKAQGVKVDMPVIAGDGLAGRVIKVTANTAEVLLIIDRNSAVAARVDRSGETGVLRGEGTSDLRLELLDPKADVTTGDRILTSGYDKGLFPSGIPIGSVVEAPKAGARLTRVVTVQPIVDFSALDHVLVVTGERSRKGAR